MKGKHMIVTQIVPTASTLVDYLDRNHGYPIYGYDIWIRDLSDRDDGDFWYDGNLRTGDDVAEYYSSISLDHNIVGVEVKPSIVKVEVNKSSDHTTNIDANVIESLVRYVSDSKENDVS